MPLPTAPLTKGATVDKSQYGPAAKRLGHQVAGDATAPEAVKPIADVTTETPLVVAPEAHFEPCPTHVSRLRQPRAQGTTSKPRLFVLDTNVLLHDPTCLFRFEEHDIFLPMTTLEELDNHKKGVTDIARNARQVSRCIDQLLAGSTGTIDDGIALNGIGNKEASGKLFLQTIMPDPNSLAMLQTGKADNTILRSVRALQETHPDKNVVLVSKDINMRIKATALGLAAEDYYNDKTIDDADLLYSGMTVLPEDFWDSVAVGLETWQADNRTWYRFKHPIVDSLHVNEFVVGADGAVLAQVRSIEADKATIATLKDYMQPKNAVWGVYARNIEQCLAMNLLMDPDIDFVTILGQAGTGKTLLTLAAALTQTLDMRKFTEIIVTRATVSVGEDIGYLPGTEEEKMAPWMGALEDNLEVLNKSDRSMGEWARNAAVDLIKSRIRVKSMSFMRGRTFLNKFVIIDEAQNLSPKQMKTLITRAGPGSKIVCLGNIAQIDTPYLTEGSSGLTYVVDRFKGWSHAGHVTLQRGERSRLADYASDVL